MSVTTKENQGRGRPTLFTDEMVRKIIHLERQEMSYAKMSEIIHLHPNTIRTFVSRNREKLNIERRGYRGFDREWYGYVPRGHWMMCKPWGSKRFYEALRKAIRRGQPVSYS